jgi:anti-sigma B factor antagonist
MQRPGHSWISRQEFRTACDWGRIEPGRFPDMTNSLQIRVGRNNESTVMILRGRVDLESSPQLREALLALLRRQSSPGMIAIDLAAVAYMDSSGIATLVEALRIARIHDIEMHLEGLEGRLRQLFQSTGIGSLFDISGPTNSASATAVS